MKNEELINFKKLLEYFVSHLEWIETNDENIKGYDKYIRPLIEDNSFKITGQGYDGAGIQNQISNWDEYESGKVCINIQGNYGSYKSVKCYLNWIDTGINILARWSGSRIVSLYQDEFIYWEKPTRRVSLNIEYSLEELNIFGDDNITNELSNFYQSFVNAHEKLKQNEKKKQKMKSILAISKILNYKKQIILQGPPGTGKTREAKLIAKEILGLNFTDDLKNNEQFKLIQFHPSYTYEDFVRGIVAKPNEDGDGILYEAENKTLSRFAVIAFENFLDSQKENAKIKNKPVFDAFIEFIKEEIAQSDLHKFNLTDAVYLFSADETRFKYKGDNWVAHNKGLNMKFSELKKIIDSGATERQDIKRMSELEELTRQHATYFIKLVEKFYEFEKTYELELPNIQQSELKNFVLVIDEINRANLSSVLGELIYALEYRGEEVESMYKVDGSQKLILPPNLYIIGTMNTADRSVGHIDYAIRRRFAFVEVLPNVLKDENIVFHEDWFKKVSELFITNYDEYFADDDRKVILKPAKTLSSEFRPEDVWLGHSYFIQEKLEENKLVPKDFRMKIDYEIKPILLEYVKDGVLIGKVGEQKIEDYIKNL